MPAANQSNTSSQFGELLESRKQDLFTAFPELSAIIDQIVQSRFEEDLPTSPRYSHKKTSLSPEEQLEILQKLRQLSQLPGSTFDTETQLYLEQQLADLFGFEVSTTYQDLSLPFVKTTIESLPHLKSSPNLTDSLALPIPEAGLQSSRTLFGWHMNNSSTKESTDYWVSVPIRSLVSSQLSLSDIKKKTFKKKILLINPTEALYAVAHILDDYEDISHKYQLGGSPNLTREGLFWSPQNKGACMVFLINDSSSPEPGIYDLLQGNQ